MAATYTLQQPLHLSSEGLRASSACDWLVGDRPHRPRLRKLVLAMALLPEAAVLALVAVEGGAGGKRPCKKEPLRLKKT